MKGIAAMITIDRLSLKPSSPSRERPDVGIKMPLMLNEDHQIFSGTTNCLAFSVIHSPSQNGKYVVWYSQTDGQCSRVIVKGQWLSVPARDVHVYILIEEGPKGIDQIRICDPEVWQRHFQPELFFADELQTPSV